MNSITTYTIMPDYGQAYCWITNGNAEASNGVGGCCSLPRVHRGMRMHRHPLEREFEAWQLQFDRVPPHDFTGFNWRQFHLEGIALARRLKVSLGDAARVVYEKPTEDPDHEYQERREVMLDGTLVDLADRRTVNLAAASPAPEVQYRRSDQGPGG